MRPVFEQLAVSEMLVEPLRQIRAQPAEQNEIRATRDDMNRVDLQLRHLRDRAENVCLGRLAARWSEQALSGQMQRACCSQG
jgi:hypothetical protein